MRAEQAHDGLAVLAVAVVAGERGQAEQADGGEPVGAGRGVVHQVLRAGDERLGVVAGGEHAAVVVVPEELEQRVGGRPRLGDPASLAGGLGQAGEGVDERAVVGGVGEVPGAGVGLPRAQPAAVGPAQVGEEELGRLHGGVDPRAARRSPRRLRRATATR